MTDVSPAGDDQLRKDIESLSRTNLSHVCAILGLQDSGTQQALRASLLSLLGGPPSRRRRNWLRLGFRVAVTAGKQPNDELDDSSLAEFNTEGGELLLELRERVSSSAFSTNFNCLDSSRTSRRISCSNPRFIAGFEWMSWITRKMTKTNMQPTKPDPPLAATGGPLTVTGSDEPAAATEAETLQKLLLPL